MNKRHGLHGCPEYWAWCSMKKRCLNKNHPSYSNYGGRGITIEPSWIDNFSSFYEHIGPRPTPSHSLDRIINELGYVLGNVRWATKLKQEANKRRTLKVVQDGIVRPLVEVAREKGFEGKRYTVIAQRFLRGTAIANLFDPIVLSFTQELNK